MKIIGTEQEITYIKDLLSKCDYECKNCIYEDGCKTDTAEICSEYVLKNIDIELIK